LKKLAVVRAMIETQFITINPHVSIFTGVPGFDTSFVGYIVGNEEWLDNSRFVHARIRKLLPDFISDFMVRRPYSPVSFVELRGIEKILKDVHIINCLELYSFISRQCAKFAKKTKKKLVVNVWETIPTLPINFCPPHLWNVRTVQRCADIFIAHTRRAANYLKCLSIPDEKIKVVYPGIDLKVFMPSEKCSHSKFRILFFGRFDNEKGLSILLQAFARLSAERSDAELWIRAKQSTGEMEALARTYARKCPIKFLDYVNYDKISEIYRQCDVLCLPSFDREKWGIKVWEEQFGFVLMEAMACGLPIIASDCGAIPEVIGTENLIVRQKSVDDLYFALLRVIKDESYREYISKANRARAEKLFDLQRQRRKVGKILYELLV